MTDNVDPNVGNSELDEFENEFYGTSTEVVEDEAKPADTEDDEVDNLDDDNPVASDEDETEDEEEAPKPKKNSAQKRINELLERERLANERAEALARRIEALEASSKKEVEDPQPLREQLPTGAPNPDAKTEDGEAVYPLGEFDPQYIRDLTKFTIDAEMQQAKAAQEAAAREAILQQELEGLVNTWAEKVEQAEEQIPELRENIAELTDTFKDIDPSYGDYLSMTIMQSDVGPEILNYLSQNIGEAQKIVAAGPVAATLALGRLEARFQRDAEPEVKRNSKKVSEAPEPPETRTRGSGGQFAVRGDTDNLDAFEKVFFNK